MRNSIIFVTIALFCVPCAYSQQSPSPHIRTVERFVAAFNSHDAEAMAELVADDVAWLSVTGEDVAVEVAGKNALVESMNAYFDSCPTCRSELAEVISTPGRVSAIEIATWQGKSGSRSQRSISVYEFSDQVIRRVYYFPSEH